MFSNLLYYLTYLFKLIKYIEDHSAFYMFLITFITFGAIIWYTWETRRLVKKTSESVNITKEKEKIDRTLKYIENFDMDRFKKLIYKKIHDYPKEIARINRKKDFYSLFPEYMEEIEYYINYFDTIAILYFKNKLDKELFDIKISPFLFNFANNYNTEIIKRVKDTKSFDVNIFYWFKNLINLIIEIYDKKIALDTSGWKIHFIKDLEEYKKLVS